MESADPWSLEIDIFIDILKILLHVWNSLEEDEHNQSISGDGDDPEDEEKDAEEMLDEGMGGREGGPELVGDLEDLLGGCVGVLGTCYQIADQRRRFLTNCWLTRGIMEGV